MIDLVTTGSTAVPTWMVQLRLHLANDGRPAPGDDEVEPMVELLERTAGVRSVAVVPLEAGLAVAIGLDARDPTTALERARHLALACCRYAGLGEVAVGRATVGPAPGAGDA